METYVRRRAGGIILVVAIATLAAPLAARAQQPRKVYRIGFLSVQEGPTVISRGFVQGLRDLGYLEGQILAMEYRWAAGKSDRLLALAADLVRAKVDIIVTQGTPATMAAKKATRTIPIVFASAADPVEKAIVASLAHPGGNITGLAIHVGYAKLLQVLKETVPAVSRVAYLYDPAVTAPEEYLKTVLATLEADGRALKVKVQPIPMRKPNEVERVFPEARRSGAQGLLVEGATSILMVRERLCALATRRGLPAIGRGREFADAGCLMSYGENFADMNRRAATYVDKILKGTKPADLPVEQPMRSELVINLKTAKALGLTIPQSVLIRADQVIQ